jgi:mannosyltransferase OCH1-like enzyme
MAYFLWDDDGVLQLLKEYEPAFLETFEELPANVERTDVFRILVSKYIGGIYADIDTEPLKAPAKWVSPSDITPWSDPLTDTHYPSLKGTSPHPSTHAPVSILLGIEADCPPKADTYWRMGYSYPLQLTQWALASAPNHPVLTRFMHYLTLHLQQISEHHGGNLKRASKELASIDPVVLTGPAAVTLAAKSWLAEKCGLRWNALTGLQDGGKAKLVEDVLILPITAFSPGRGRYGNMGSKPISDPAARVLHHAQGSWRKLDLKVQLGKLCRTLLGRCRDWSTVPDADESIHPGDFLGKRRQ